MVGADLHSASVVSDSGKARPRPQFCNKEKALDDQRFDDMTRVLGRQSARRGMLKAATGGVLGLVGLSALADSALAARCRRNNDCRPNERCVNRRCVECDRDRDCSNGQFCVDNQCVDCRRNRDCRNNEKCNRRGQCVRR